MADEHNPYRAASHTCTFCNQPFESFWEYEGGWKCLFIDLASGLDAISAAEQGCTFFQNVLYPSFFLSRRVCGSCSGYVSTFFRSPNPSDYGVAAPDDHNAWKDILGAAIAEEMVEAYWHAYIEPEPTQDDPWFENLVCPPNLNPLSTRAIALMDSWFKAFAIDKEVGSSHGRCLPRRLLQIEPESSTVRLVKSEEMHNYALLSYCWGNGQNARTTKSSLSSHEQGFHLDFLPQTIRDAIYITHLLQLRYLWVDALCIVQDDDEELAEEIAKQARIYQRGAVTILAGNCAGVDQGFLHPRSRSQYSLCVGLPNGEKRRLLLQNSQRLVIDDVAKRAWIFQEILLSPRLLYFSPAQMMFFNEQDVYLDGGLREHWFGFRNGFTHGATSATYSRSQDPVELARLREIWHTLTDSYSNRALTYPADRLPAIAGIAEVMGAQILAANGSQIQPRYCAGLWETHMPFNLLWTVSKRVPRPPYRAPSWSWASVDGEIWYPGTEGGRLMPCSPNEYTAVVTHVRTQLAAQSAPYGEVTGGELQIRGFVKNIPDYLIEGVTDRKGCDLHVQSSRDLGGFFYLDAIEPNMLYPCEPDSGYVLSILCIDRVVMKWQFKKRKPVTQPVSGHMHGLILCRKTDQECHFRLGRCGFRGTSVRQEEWLDTFELRTVTIV